MKNYIPLFYLALGGLWLYISPTEQSAAILSAMALIYLIVLGYRKSKPRVEVLPPEEDENEFHNDFSRVGSAEPGAKKISTCCKLK